MAKYHCWLTIVGLLFGIGSVGRGAQPSAVVDVAVQPAGEDALGCCRSAFSPCASSPWEAKVGFVLLQRSGLPSRELARGLGESPQPFLNASQFGFDFEGGPDLTILRHGDCADLEFRWFQVHDSIAETPTMNSDGWGFPFRYLIGLEILDVDLSARYMSQLNSFELNLKQPVNDWITAFAGFRFVEFNELLAYTATPAGDDPLPLFVRSFNDLYGFQVGSDITLWDRGGPFRVAATGKAGVYGNYARNRSDDGGDSGNPDFVDSASTGHAAFQGEIGVVGTYQITRRLTARIGYQVMWFDGVALASEQQPRLDPAHDDQDFGSPSVATGGTAFYHGVVGGFDLRF